MGTSSRLKGEETVPVLLDTNMLIYSASEPFEIRSQLERLGFKNIIVTEGVKRELERLAQVGRTKEKKFAKLSLEIAKKFGTMPDPPITGSVDDQLVYISKQHGYIVATSDASLRRRLKREGLPVIYIKNRRLISECDLITKTTASKV
jgi:rRNA-processing protein FCF1